ncbi:hypothetical protein Tsp_13847, partial [Trichinella spiralis]|uniref:hypothetical protein n=1 Tax=Trichinella spiralis TaxID=6334 RepID=UPI0001EFDA96
MDEQVCKFASARLRHLHSDRTSSLHTICFSERSRHPGQEPCQDCPFFPQHTKVQLPSWNVSIFLHIAYFLQRPFYCAFVINKIGGKFHFVNKRLFVKVCMRYVKVTFAYYAFLLPRHDERP